MDLTGKRIVVTGISKDGIGYECCKLLASKGAKIAGIDYKTEDGEELANSLPNMSFYQGDVSDKGKITQTIQQISQDMGGIDTLVNAAAIHITPSPEDWQPADMDRILKVNIEGTVFVNQAVCQEMKKNNPQGGCILNFGSMDAFTSPDGIYGGTKAAVMTWTRTIAREWAQKYHIRANSILPVAMTHMYKEFLSSLTDQQKEKHFKMMAKRIPISGRPGKPIDIANYVAFLVSDEESYVNGSLIEIDGGDCMLRG